MKLQDAAITSFYQRMTNTPNGTMVSYPQSW